VELVCDIAELASLFEKSSKLDDLLQTAVSLIAWHMKAAVCSIYLVNRKNGRLDMRANQGLRPDAIGKVSMELGEGLTGLALKEMRPICVGRGSKHPGYKPFQDIEEEKYEAFLAVPIVRGLQKVGVIVVQDDQPDYFDTKDATALKAIAAQLASTIQNADLFLSLKERVTIEEAAPEKKTVQKMVKGRSISGGIVQGTSVVISPKEDLLAEDEGEQGYGNLTDFRDAVRKSEKQLNDMQRDLEKKHSDIASMIFNAHLLMLQDQEFSGLMQRVIEDGEPASRAVIKVVNQYIQIFSNSSNPLLKEKVQDVSDLGHRLLQNMLPEDIQHPDYNGNIVITREMMPSDVVKLTAQRVDGIVLVGGNPTSHVSILLQSFSIPVVLVDDPGVLEVEENRKIILDAENAMVHLDADEHIYRKYEDILKREQELQDDMEALDDKISTRDGIPVALMANVNLVSDVDLALKNKAGGIGLYRSEFPFLVRNDFPSEEEQCIVYRNILNKMDGQQVIFRTLDLGGDKMMSYFPTVNEANPFLGLRAIRFSLQNKEIFGAQLRAMLRAGYEKDLRIMFPMISSLDDFTQAREVIQDCIRQLKSEDIEHNPDPVLGVMIEIPSAVEIIDELAAEAKFLCVG
ncbi:MAG: putative PEP-binding protein, partial [Verrucomicrobiota bacterium]